MSDLLRLPFEISAAVHLGGERSSASATSIRIEGFRESVMAREAEIEKRLQVHGEVKKLVADETAIFGRRSKICPRSVVTKLASGDCLCLATRPGPFRKISAVRQSTIGVEATCTWRVAQKICSRRRVPYASESSRHGETQPCCARHSTCAARSERFSRGMGRYGKSASACAAPSIPTACSIPAGPHRSRMEKPGMRTSTTSCKLV
jgi:hypothetical protein